MLYTLEARLPHFILVTFDCNESPPPIEDPFSSHFCATTTIDWTREPDEKWSRFGDLDHRVKPWSPGCAITATTTTDGLRKAAAEDGWWQEVIRSDDNVAALRSILQSANTSLDRFQNPPRVWTQKYLYNVFQTAYQAALFQRLCQVIALEGAVDPCLLPWGRCVGSAGVVNVHILHPTTFLIQKSIMRLTLTKQAWGVKKTLHNYLDLYERDLTELTMKMWLEKVGREWGVCTSIEE
jgi:hypothetical protein